MGKATGGTQQAHEPQKISLSVLSRGPVASIVSLKSRPGSFDLKS